MRVSSAYGSREGVEPVVEIVVQLRATGTRPRVCAPPACAAAREGEAPPASGVIPAGGWR
jgi:hypothetical protein